VTLLELDVTDKQSIERAVEKVKGTGDGKLKYLVNNAGRGVVGPLLDGDESEERKVFEVNYWCVSRIWGL
jgi:short-subunit dehydrogenase